MITGKVGNRIEFNNLWILFLILILLIMATVWIALQNQREFKDRMVQQWKEQLLTTTRISSINTESFVEKFSENLLNISGNPLVKEKAHIGRLIREDTGFCCVENLYNIHEKDINSILLLSKTGLIIKKYPWWKDSSKVIKYCKWGVENERGLSPGEASISDVFENQMGNPAFSISSPVFYDSAFTGVVRWMIEIRKISSKYIDSISVGENGYMWLVDNNGIIRAHHDKTFRGLKPEIILQDYFATKKVSGYNTKKSLSYLKETSLLFDQIKTEKEGVGNIIDFAHNEYSLAVFRKVLLGDKEWTLIMNIPYAEIIGPVYKNALKNIGFAAFVALLLAVIFISIYQSQRTRTQLEKETKYLSELARTAEDLEAERQKRLTAQIDGQELERNRVSRELHDGLGQQLLAVKVRLEELSAKLPERFSGHLDSLRSLFMKTIEETKRISYDLMPVTLEELGIQTALKNLCDEFERNNKIKVDYVTHGVPENIGPKYSRYIYRIAQEAINNIMKHARATEVNVQFLGNSEQITLLVHDDGAGFDYYDGFKSMGNGLNNIKDRVTILKGSIEIESDLNKGTSILVKVPLK